MYKTSLHPDSVEFYSKDPELVAVGLYQLDENTKTREGGIQLLQLKQGQFTPLHLVDCPGIFDLKWFDSQLAVASSDGSVDFYKLENRQISNKLISSTSEGRMVMSLSVAWNATGDQLSSTFTNGLLNCLALANEIGSIRVLDPHTAQSTWSNENAHKNEVWSSRFDSVEPHILYSGSDDCTFKGWDLRASQSKPMWTNTTEMAGITTFETSTQWPNVLLVGGYNEKVTAWDLRKPTKQDLCSIVVDGGVWRIRSRPSDSRLAVAAMRGYFRLLNFDTSHFQLDCLAIHDKVHSSESLCYGIDWMPGQDVMVCASFYDDQVSLWDVASL